MTRPRKVGQQLRLFDEQLPQVHRVLHAPLAVRTSRRAQRLILRLVPPHTLELVVPRGARPPEIEAFVAEHRDWIERARAEIAERYGAESGRLPAKIELRAVGQSWDLDYVHAPQRRPTWSVSGERLKVSTRDADHAGAPQVLRAWLVEQGSLHLKPWLLREAQTVGLAPTRVQVRLQRTRWGSCSPTGNISVNASLLFLEPAVVRYLLIHELCHLRWMNHSKRYWAHVERFEPDYRRLDRQLSKAWADVPLWAHDH